VSEGTRDRAPYAAKRHACGERARAARPDEGEIQRMNIAFVGLGAMGRGMSRRLIGAGHAVAGHDVVPDA